LVTVLAYAARDAELRELLEVLVPLDAATRTTSLDEARRAIARADAYYDSRREQFQWQRGEHDPDASLSTMILTARMFGDALATMTGIPGLCPREPLSIMAPASFMHLYARAITGNPNLFPLHGQSTQIIQGRWSWLTRLQVKEIARAELGLRIPKLAALRTERKRVAYPPLSEQALNELIVSMASPWIRTAELLSFAAESGLAYVAYDQPPDSD
jgi:hypothetical protein